MTETVLFSYGVGISFVFLAGAYVYLREKSFFALQQAQPIPIRPHRSGQDTRAVATPLRRQ